ncbi:MAG: SDR family NAD(P)-dependent oxidoreductase [Planctomycetaceae bacterium]
MPAPTARIVRSTPQRGRRRLAGLRAVVTGASSGVGAAVARALAARGTRVLATARRGERLAALAAETPAATPILWEAGDLTDAAFRRRLVAAAAERLGGIDVVVAAAGCGAIGPFRDADPATLERVMDVDFRAPVELVRLCLPLLRGSADPAVVLVGSILGRHPLPLHGEYCAAKAALASFAGSLRVELAGDVIDVVLASLGPTESEFWDSLVAGSRPTWSQGRRMPADRAAAAIVAGLERRSRELLPGWQAKGFALVARLAPGVIDALTSRRLRAAKATGGAG